MSNSDVRIANPFWVCVPEFSNSYFNNIMLSKSYYFSGALANSWFSSYVDVYVDSNRLDHYFSHSFCISVFTWKNRYEIQ